MYNLEPPHLLLYFLTVYSFFSPQRPYSFRFYPMHKPVWVFITCVWFVCLWTWQSWMSILLSSPCFSCCDDNEPASTYVSQFPCATVWHWMFSGNNSQIHVKKHCCTVLLPWKKRTRTFKSTHPDPLLSAFWLAPVQMAVGVKIVI